MGKKDIGRFGEAIACDFMGKNGYAVVAKNWLAGHYEIDLIAENDDFIVFVEVKTRKSSSPVSAEQAINRKKQQNIIAAANQYIKKNGVDKEARFDLFFVYYSNKSYKTEYIQDAFYPTV